MEVGTDARKRILAGDYSALKFDRNPELSVGDCITLLWSKEQRHVSDQKTGEVITTPRLPLFWIEVSHPPFLREGKWIVRFHVYDRREDPRYLGPGGGYTSSPHLSTDKDQGVALQAVDDDTLERFAKENRARGSVLREEDERRRQERALRERIKRLAQDLDPLARAAFLAWLERKVEQAEAELDEAA